MYRPPLDPRHRSAVDRLTWRGVLTSYAVVAAMFLSLWSVSHPLAGVLSLATLAGVVLVARRAASLIRCFHECQGFSFDLAGTARITVTQLDADESA